LKGRGFKARGHQLYEDLRHGWKPCTFKTIGAVRVFGSLWIKELLKENRTVIPD
jgi:hypothetical protein